MSINTSISKWIEKSELVIDYYTMFIKVWIPFNAWYMHNFYDEDEKRTSDRSIIDHIKDNDNPYKDKIKNLLLIDSDEGKIFRDYINKLHIELTNNPIPSYENRIGFDKITLYRNSQKLHTFQKGNYIYKCEFKDQLPKTSNRFICEVIQKKSQTTKHRIELNQLSITNLEKNSNFISIKSDNIKEILKICFEEINPNKSISIVLEQNKVKRNNHIKIAENLYFIKDENLVSQAIIHLIYDLRCKLFHGEIEPKKAYEKIYEYAYHIQRILIQTLQ